MLLTVTKKRPWPDNGAFPYSVPALQTFERLELAPITFFVGENGSGKSTLLEAIAMASEIPSLGSDDRTLTKQRELGDHLRLAWSRRSRKGFFMRAEDFFGWMQHDARIDARVLREKREPAATMRPLDEHGNVLPPIVPPEQIGVDHEQSRHVDEVDAIRFFEPRDARSHGESFLELFSRRVHPSGLYLLDEPEAPLSPKRQIALLELMEACVRAGAQLVVATHSPILLACKDAKIVSFDRTPIAEVAYEELEHVTVMRAFLNQRLPR